MHYDIITEVLKPEGVDFKKTEERKLIIRDPYVKVAEKLRHPSFIRQEDDVLESLDFELSLSQADKDDRKSVPFGRSQ